MIAIRVCKLRLLRKVTNKDTFISSSKFKIYNLLKIKPNFMNIFIYWIFEGKEIANFYALLAKIRSFVQNKLGLDLTFYKI